MNVLDGIIILIVLIGALRGRRKGLIAMIGRLVGYFAAFLLAVFCYHPVANLMNKEFNFVDKLTPFLNKQMGFSQDIKNMPIKEIPFSKLVEMVNGQKIPTVYRKIITGFVNDIQSMPVTHGIEKLGDGIICYLSLFIIDAIAFITIYYLTIIIFAIFFKRTSNKMNFTLLGKANKMSGFVVGGLSSLLGTAFFIIIFAPLTTIILMGSHTGVMAGIGKIVSGSVLANFFIKTVAKIIT